MCDIMEELLKKERKQQSIKTAMRILASGKLTLEEIAEYSDLSLDDVQCLVQSPTELPT